MKERWREMEKEMKKKVEKEMGGDGRRWREEVLADVDELLDLADALRQDLSHFEGHELTEGVAMGTELEANVPNDLKRREMRRWREMEREMEGGEIRREKRK